jgi:hypothetical protein
MNHKRTLISVVKAVTVLVSLFAVVSSAVSGKPNSDDWVRTCAAQAQVYPLQVLL